MKRLTRIGLQHTGPRRIQRQSGAALIVTIFVLMALTVVAISLANSNQSQAIMVRNSQFRLEAFNISYAEIDGQVDYINARKLSDGVPDYILAIIDGNVGSRVTSDGDDSGIDVMPVALPTHSSVANSYASMTADQTYRGACLLFGQQLGAGEEKIQCSDIQIRTDATLANTSVGSTQSQVYQYRTLKE